MLKAVGLAEFHQSGCPLLLRKQLQTHSFCLALYSLPRGCSTTWLGWREGDLSRNCIIPSRDMIIFWSLCSVLARWRLKTSRKAGGERSHSAVCLGLTSSTAAARSKTTNACCCLEMFAKMMLFCHLKILWHLSPLFSFLPAPTSFLCKCFSWVQGCPISRHSSFPEYDALPFPISLFALLLYSLPRSICLGGCANRVNGMDFEKLRVLLQVLHFIAGVKVTFAEKTRERAVTTTSECGGAQALLFVWGLIHLLPKWCGTSGAFCVSSGTLC